mgnify:CR=1 FL=1
MKYHPKILLLTEIFPPAFNPRMGYLVKYLNEYGWEVQVVTENIVKEGNFGYLANIDTIKRVNLKNTSTPKGIFQKTWRLLNKYRHFRNNKKPFTKVVFSNYCRTDFSLVLVSVSWNLFVLEAGYEISKKWNLPLVVDFRDMIEQKPADAFTDKNFLVRLIEQHFSRSILAVRNSIMRIANHVICVTPLNLTVLKLINQNSSLIYNGYDSDLFKPQRNKTEVFRVIYTGIILNELEQDPSLLFQAVNKLSNENIIDSQHFKIAFYTPQSFRLVIQNNPYFKCIEKYIEFNDYVDYTEVNELFNNSSVGLTLTNVVGSSGPKGVITTKFFEYLGAEIPVLCVKSDEEIMEKLIHETAVGCSARTVEEAYNFIYEKWLEWKEKGFTTANINQDVKSQFTRRHQAEQFIAIFENILNKQSK